MQYRYFAGTIGEIFEQFVRYYGKENILQAETQEDFEYICDIDDEYKAIILDTALFQDILIEENIYRIKSLEKKFEYIVFVGKDILELNEKIRKL